MLEGSKQIGKYFRQAREFSPFKTIDAFAQHLDVDGAHLGRVEAGKRLPGPEYLRKILPYYRAAGGDPMALFYAWLEAQGLDDYIKEIKRKR